VISSNLADQNFAATSRLLAKWNFENASARGEDSSGNGRTLTLGSAVTFGSDASGTFAQFASTSTATNANNRASFTSPVVGSTVTHAAWFNASTLGGGSLGRIFETPGYLLYLYNNGTNNVIRFSSRRSPTSGYFDTPAVTLGQWNHVVVVYNSASTANVPAIYINGSAVAVTTTAPVGNQKSNSGTGYVGNASGSNRGFDGKLDNLRIYDGVLTAAEVAALYANEP
jgi:MSHA biogenesis protein MshQ